MKRIIFMFLMVGIVSSNGWHDAQAGIKKRIMVVSSYHREYLWSQDTNEGVCAALLGFGYMDDKSQAARYTKDDYVETSKAIIQKMWMDTKRKNSLADIAQTTKNVTDVVEKFNPDIILLGDDNAANYIGNHFIDTQIPIVFWGVDVRPDKYGLVDSIAKPGHNVTGVYQPGYSKEGVDFLLKLLPEIKTMAILSDDSETGRAKAKNVQQLAEQGKIPVTIIGTVMTNSQSAWKAGAMELAKTADAFFVVNHNTIKDEKGRPVEPFELGAWYLRNIKKPDITPEKQFIEEGFLLAVNDSGFMQGYEAVRMAHRILSEGAKPATMTPFAPGRGKLMLNRERARMLGLAQGIQDNPLIEEIIETSKALAQYPEIR
ncbi:MAG: hypothetical protein H7839_23955 [Magnetococcus sp. YQC-5]